MSAEDKIKFLVFCPARVGWLGMFVVLPREGGALCFVCFTNMVRKGATVRALQPHRIWTQEQGTELEMEQMEKTFLLM